MMHWFMMNYCFDHGYDRYNFMVYLVILLKIVKIMVFIALKEGLMCISRRLGISINQLINLNIAI